MSTPARRTLDPRDWDVAVNSYLETLIWSSTLSCADDDDGEPTVMVWGDATYADGCPLSDIIDSSDDIMEAVREQIRGELGMFRDCCLEDIGVDPLRFFDPKRVAHNFCLSRNGHGAGFFDSSWAVNGQELNHELQRVAAEQCEQCLQVWVDDAGELCVEAT